MPRTNEEIWKRFIDHLNLVQPLGRKDKKDPKSDPILHQNFLGSIASYRKVFLEAQNAGDPKGAE